MQSLYFLVPAYFANMAPVIVKNVPFLKYPADFGLKLGKLRLFGENKTIRGLVFAVAFAIIAAFVQYLLANISFFQSISVVNYDEWLPLGILLGSGAILGDLIESFIKRRLNLKSGAKFIPFDQIDFVAGALLFVSFMVTLSVEIVIACFVVSFGLHILVNHIAYYTGVRKERW